MSTYSILESTLNDILQVIKPLREDWGTRFEVVHELREVVRSVESLRGATVEPFGSFISNLFTRWGDLDISVELNQSSCVSSAGKKRKQNLLGDLLRALRQRGGLQKLEFVAHARVPILKFESNHHGISCDISIDNLQGQIKSKFLFWISEIDGRFRDLVLLVKEWAKANDINNPRAGTLNSYSLSLLVVFHFQTCAPAILPPLKDIYPRNVVDDLTGMRANAERHVAETCAANIARFKSDRSRAVNRSSLSELFISFLAKFSELSSKASDLGICTFTGKWEDIRSNARWLPKKFALFIEDPFEQPENAARAVSARQMIRICQVFEMSRCKLISANHNKSALLATLAGPQTSQFIPGAQVRVPSYTGGRRTHPMIAIHSSSQVQQVQQFQFTSKHSPSRSQLQHQKIHSPFPVQQRIQVMPMHLPVQVQPQFQQLHSPAQFHHQFQNIGPLRPQSQSQVQVRQERQPYNLTTQRSVQPYHGQGSKTWRPKSEMR